MKVKVWSALFMPAYLTACAAPGPEKYQTSMDSVTAEKVSQIIRSDVIPSSGEDHGEVIRRVSSAFLGTPYQADTLIGGPDIPEALVVNFNGVDCFTVADYIEALTRSHDQQSFLHNLAQVRYTGGNVSYLSRRHFFSDWFATAPRNARDITQDLSPDYAVADKQLNRKPDGGEYIPGLGIHPRKINYIPGEAISQQVLDHLKTGDYVGVYSPHDGLDVSHVGIVVRHDGQVWFRNASSLAANRKVVDSPFREYMRAKPGIVVLRAEWPPITGVTV
ncbi:putative inner membrane protein [Dickeya aquatica]|uniref:Putative inner membrane protein n=1 Tax=Dickeya aquatica TaxID=1401087 RepID=A0A375A8S4_9GAMM|nr:putative inner membrane protein [Dickeya aquatica]